LIGLSSFLAQSVAERFGYQRSFLDTYRKVAFTKLYDRKNVLVAADLLNDRALPFVEEHDIPMVHQELNAGRVSM